MEEMKGEKISEKEKNYWTLGFLEGRGLQKIDIRKKE